MTGKPAQSQPYPGETSEMHPRPKDEMRHYEGRGLLNDKCALVTGGDSGIGRAVAVGFAKEGADVAITYLEDDARHTRELIESEGRRCLTIGGDMDEEDSTRAMVCRVAEEFGRLDVLVLHHGTQKPVGDIREITTEQLERTFHVNVHSLVWTIQEALDHMPDDGFGEQSPMGRAAEPDEIAPSYIFFASNRLSSFYTGQNLVPAGGEIHPG